MHATRAARRRRPPGLPAPAAPLAAPHACRRGVVSALHQMGLACVLLTGDNWRTARAIGDQVRLRQGGARGWGAARSACVRSCLPPAGWQRLARRSRACLLGGRARRGAPRPLKACGPASCERFAGTAFRHVLLTRPACLPCSLPIPPPPPPGRSWASPRWPPRCCRRARWTRCGSCRRPRAAAAAAAAAWPWWATASTTPPRLPRPTWASRSAAARVRAPRPAAPGACLPAVGAEGQAGLRGGV